MRWPPTSLLVRRQGKGTFVATHAEEQVQYRFLRLMPDEGAREAMQRRFLDFRRLRAPADVARALDLTGRRQRAAAAPPAVWPGQCRWCWTTSGCRARLFKGLTAERLSAYRGPMYGLFEAEFGVHMIRAEEKIRAVAAGRGRGRAARRGRRARRCCWWSGAPSPMPTARWNCAAACTAPKRTTIAMN